MPPRRPVFPRRALHLQPPRSRPRWPQEAGLRREIDRILDKMNREGEGALTDEERRFLKDASRKLRS